MRLPPPSRYVPHLAILALIGVATALVAVPRTFRGSPEGPIYLTMPKELGPYRGEKIYFCQNDQCARSFHESNLSDAQRQGTNLVCSTCGAPLESVAVGENAKLPPGTPIFRKIYTSTGRPHVQLSAVFTGADRKSIHRPQVCLVAQGNQIQNEYSREISISPTDKLKVRVLEYTGAARNETGKKVTSGSIFAYWFFNPEYETDSHFRRMLRQSVDDMITCYRPRWAYVSCVVPVDPERPGLAFEILDDFIPRVYPLFEECRRHLRDLDAGIPAGPDTPTDVPGYTGHRPKQEADATSTPPTAPSPTEQSSAETN